MTEQQSGDTPQRKKNSDGSKVRDAILGSVGSRTGKVTSDWLADLTEVKAAVENLEEKGEPAGSRALSESDGPHDSMIEFVDCIFDCFQQYEFEFNKTEPEPDLLVSVDRPSIIRDRGAYEDSAEVAHFFKGRLSTPQWALVIGGGRDKIEGFVLPVDRLIAFSADPYSFHRFLLIEATRAGGQVSWFIDGVEVPPDRIRDLARRLFASLILIAKGEAGAGEVFSLIDQSQMPHTHIQPGPHQAEELRSTCPPACKHHEHGALADLETGPPADAPLPVGQYSQPGPPARPGMFAQALSHLGQPHPVPDRPSPPAVAQPAPALPSSRQPHPDMPGPEAARALRLALETDQVNYDHACDLIRQCIDHALDRVAQSGMEALARQDIQQVKELSMRTGQLVAMRDQMRFALSAWRSSLYPPD